MTNSFCKGAAVLFAPVLCCALLGGAADVPRGETAEKHADTKPHSPLVLQPINTEPTLHNLLKITPELYSGGEPVGEEAFARLKALGISTVVSVDGAKPNVEAARKHGLRYVHVPIGYDGISKEESAAFYRIGKEAEGPIYVHCHHGKHRGPAAAAVVCRAANGLDAESAAEILAKAGTSRDYSGLWRDVAAFQPPAEGTPLPELVEAAEVGSLAAAMASIDHAWDNLRLAKDAGWKTPADHPDVVPEHQALLIREGFHESLRNLPAGYGNDVRAGLEQAEELAAAIEKALKRGQPAEATQHLEALSTSCTACHKQHRN